MRQFHIHIGRCEQCGQRVQGRHPLQTSDALGAAASPIGPDAQAAAGVLHTQMGLSHGKVAAVFDALFGIDLTRGASAQINLRAAARLEPVSQLILDDVRMSEQIAADETGWRVGATVNTVEGGLFIDTRRERRVAADRSQRKSGTSLPNGQSHSAQRFGFCNCFVTPFFPIFGSNPRGD